jgi:beta-galactosidase
MIGNESVSFWYGADYNPEQWSSAIWVEDIERMREAGVTMITLGVFSWALLEPREGVFTFGWLDDIIDRLHQAGIRIDLATATASPPPWLSTNHPETLLVDEWGHTLSPGSRQHVNPGSATHRHFAERLVRRMAERYGQHPALAAWHVGNEFGNSDPRDYGDESAAAFRVWLERKYGTIDALNARWGTAFWSQRYASFAEVLPPRAAPTFRNPGQLLDFDRFSSDALLDAYRAEAAILRSMTPGIPITTNFMGFFKPADYWAWSREVDFVSDDAYPDPAVSTSWKNAAVQRDLMRSLRPGQPWMLMEQSTSAVNWRDLNAATRPGQMRALSYQAIARGADGIMFFQWRQSVRGGEKFHSAMLPHAGTDTRIWREVTSLGRELLQLASIAGAPVPSPGIAIMADWDSWWSVEERATPARIDYVAEITRWHHALLDLGITADFVHPGSELGAYRAVIVPTLFVVRADTAARFENFVQGGGHLLATYLTGITDQDAAFRDGGYLGDLDAVLGVRVEEFTPHPEAEPVTVTGTVVGSTGQWAEVIHAHDAEVLSSFVGGAADGGPAVTRRITPSGAAWYVGADLDASGTVALLRLFCEGADVGPEIRDLPLNVEAVRRDRWMFVINHGSTTVSVPMSGVDALNGSRVDGVELEPFGVAIVEIDG